MSAPTSPSSSTASDPAETLSPDTRTELEAATFRRLLEHLRARPEVQNLDLMNLAGFCRNCLAKWYRAEADARGVELSDPDARHIVYGMPYDAWKAAHQAGPKVELKPEPTPETKADHS